MGAYVIHDAVRSGNVAIVEALADSGAGLEVRLEGESLLHLAADHGHLDMMRWLVRKGLNPGDRNTCSECENAGRTPLHAVQRFRDDEGSALLLSLGADPNAADAAGRTPLHASASIGSSNGATVLCAHGADPGRRDTLGRTPHEVALVTGSAPRGAHGLEARPGELAGWLAPGGGCEQIAARSSVERPASQEEIKETWRRQLCERDPSLCSESPTVQ